MTTTAAAAEPAARTLRLGLQLEPPMLDPTAGAASAIGEVVFGTVFEGLVRLDAQGQPAAALAESWSLSADGLALSFRLRAGVHFHDGAPLDAEAVRFSLDRARAPGSTNPQQPVLAAVQAIEVVDPLQLRLTLARRDGKLLQVLSWAAFAIVSPASAAGNAQQPVGTGPFRFGHWWRGERIELVRNDAYWGPAPRLGRVEYLFIPDPTAAYAALMAGDVDAFPNFPAPENLAQFRADRRFRVEVGSTEGETLLVFNQRRAPMNLLPFRQAVAHAIDRGALIRGAMWGYGQPIGSHFPPHDPAYVDLTGRYPHDVARARALLAPLGPAAQRPLVLKLPPPSYARRAGEILAAELAEAGLQVRLENVEWAQWLDQVFTRHDFDLTVIAHVEPMDYDIYGRENYYFGYRNPVFNRLLVQLDEAVPGPQRTSLLQQLQRVLADDAANGFLFQLPRLTVAGVQVQGLRTDPLGRTDVASAWVDGQRHGSAADTDAAAGTGVVVARAIAAVAALLMLVLGTAAVRRFGPRLLLSRLAGLALTLLLATAVIFVLVQVAPGDPARAMLGLRAEPAAVEALRAQLGLGGSALQRYGRWLAGIAHGDLGLSYTYRVPVATLLAERLQVSLPLALASLGLAIAIALPVALVAAARRGTLLDLLLSGLAQLGVAVPGFWFGMLLVIAFAVRASWVPAGGFPGWSAGSGAAVQSLLLPALALALPQAAVLVRTLRAALIDALDEDYLRTARSKGLGAGRALWRHALPNALLPVLTILGLQLSFLLAGAVLIENVFYLPGLGRLLFQAIVQRDLIVVQGAVLLLVLAVALTSFVVDLLHRLVDPRLDDPRAPA